MKKRARAAVFLAPSLLLILCLTGDRAGAREESRDDLYRRGEVLAEVTRLILDRYVDDVDGALIFRGALRGMLESLDCHSTLLSPEEMKRLSEEASGFYVGLGVTLSGTEEGLGILAVEEGGPAWKAGIRPGNTILEIDGEPVRGMQVDRAALKLRGDAGREVRLMVKGDLGENARTLTCTRERIPTGSIRRTDMIDAEGGVGYVKVVAFRRNTALELSDAVFDLIGRGMRGLVLDLRDNPGGGLEAAAEVADLFVREGVLVTTSGRAQEDNAILRATAKSTLPPFALAVLVNGSTASAAEVVAGALSHSRRAVLVGSRTHGKTSIQSLVALEDGWVLKMTTGRYSFPSPVQEKDGRIEPDVEVTPGTGEEAVLEAAMAALRDRMK
ncbi:MAG: S41 family peptidase [Planctomycetota bacterium]|jgi:carboxyl-terminal processing protease